MQTWHIADGRGLLPRTYVSCLFLLCVEGAYTQQERAHSRRLHPAGAARPAPMRRAAHSVGAKAVVRIEDAVRPRPCLGCAVELALRISPLRRGVPPR
jgi:hypothetical protein